MDKKTLEIVQAGWAMFARYGFAKTTMSDIATQAGVARQTVYNAFSSKEDILRAVVRLAGELSLEAVKAAWEDCETVEEKVSAFQRIGPLSWYREMQSAPDWEELMDGVNKAASEELERLEHIWVSMIHDGLLEHVQDPDRASEIAQFLYQTSKNAKYGVTSIEDLEQRLATIAKATLALLR